MRAIPLSLIAIGLAACGSPADVPAPEPTPELSQDPAAIHGRMTVYDSHLDTPANFSRDDWSILDDNEQIIGRQQVDFPKMERGGLDGGFWVVYTAQGPLTPDSYAAALEHAQKRLEEIHTIADAYPSKFEIAYTVADADRIVANGKRVMFISMENSYPLGEDLSLIEDFYKRGLRMIGPVHFRDNQFADSATDLSVVSYEGLSPLGEDLVREANRLGLIVDGSHADDDTVRDIMALSSTPIILSHTGVKGVYDHPRNIDDGLMREIAADGGVIQINGLGAYLEELTPSPERDSALAALAAEYDGIDRYDMTPEVSAEYNAKRRQIDTAHPRPLSTFDKFMEHLLYALDLVGPEHIGMGADWDGGGGVTGMEDVSSLPKVTASLLEAGYTEAEIEKIWSGNMMRLLAEAEAAKE